MTKGQVMNAELGHVYILADFELVGILEYWKCSYTRILQMLRLRLPLHSVAHRMLLVSTIQCYQFYQLHLLILNCRTRRSFPNNKSHGQTAHLNDDSIMCQI